MSPLLHYLHSINVAQGTILKRKLLANIVALGCLGVLTSFLLLFSVPYAEADETTTAAGGGLVTVVARAHSVDPDGWSATVTYEKPQAGVPTEFTLTADGGPKGSGSYQYQQGFIYKYDPYIWIYDPTFPPAETFRDSNVLSYQFVGAGRYQYQFVVRDTETARYMRFSFEVEVAGDGFIDANEKAREIVAECLPDGNVDDYETALALHDWIIDNVSYDHTFRNMSVDRALSGMAVTCEGYHAAYVKLLETAGMETGRVEGGGHVWTAVKMDGKWYHVDTTHDDVKDDPAGADIPGFLSKEQQAHLLFGLDDATMELANVGYHGPTAGFEADSLENNYFIKTGDIAEWSDPVATQILGKLNQKETAFTLTPTNASWAQDSYRNVINNLVAYELNQAEWTTDNQQADAIVRIDYADNKFAVNTFTVLASAPTVVRSLTYNGASQAGLAVPSAGSYALSGTTKAIDAGTYTATVAPGAGYAWDKLGDKTARSYQWTIAPLSISSSRVSVKGVKPSYVETGAAIKPVPTVLFDGVQLQDGMDYTISYSNNTTPGTATMILTGKGNFQGSRKISFLIEGSSGVSDPAESINPPHQSSGNGSSSGGGTGNSSGAGGSGSGSPSVSSKPAAAKPSGVWRKSGGRWWYRHHNGSYTRNGWELIDGSWYHFDRSGWMQTGWLKAGRSWYYLSASGAMKTGWLKQGRTWYYLKSSGAMAVGWYKVGGDWYWSSASGAMGANRWIGNYYLKGSGAMATNQWIGRYHVNASGKWDKTR